jgi:hypothetical protein
MNDSGLVVRISRPRWIFAPPRGLLPLGLLWCASMWAGGWSYRTAAWACAAVGGAVVCLWLLFCALYWASKGAALRESGMVRGKSWADRAVQAWLVGRSWKAGVMGVDSSTWFGGVDPDEIDRCGPRPLVILVDSAFPVALGGEDVSEPVDVGAGRRLTEKQRCAARRAIPLWLAAAVLAGLFYARFSAGVSVYIAILFVLPLWAWMARLGVAPIDLSCAIATPGRIDHTRFGRTQSFTVSDSVIVIEPLVHFADQDLGRPSCVPAVSASRGRFAATIVCRDGRRTRLVYEGSDDPGLADLVARWIAPCGATAYGTEC